MNLLSIRLDAPICSSLIPGIVLLGAAVGSWRASRAESQRIFIASPAARVIYTCLLDSKTGEFGPREIAASDVSTGFMALHPTRPILYAATSEQPAVADGPNGGVRAYHIDATSGTLTQINTASTNDRGTTHIEVSRQGDCVAVCHYSGKGTSLIPIKEDGSLASSVSQVEHVGSSVHDRQKGPHPHGVAFALAGRFLCVADLGTDHVDLLQFDEQNELTTCSFWKAAPGAGPRHVAFHPNGKWLYAIHELNSTISALQFDAESGQLSEIETVTTLPSGFDGTNYTAEVVVHPSGQFVYGSNRGHDSTVVFQVDPDNGRLQAIQHEPTRGQHPRYVGINPNGTIYLAANMNSDSVVSFFVNQSLGALAPTGHEIEVEKPMCVVFVR